MVQIPLYIVALIVCLFSPKTGQYQRQNHEQLWHKETFYGPIEVIREKSTNNLKITQNYHYTLGSSLAEAREKRQAHIPLILHPLPEKIAFLGMGTGMTAKGALEHPEVQKIDIIELIPAVVDAAKFFHLQQDTIFTNPRVQIIINDARHHLSQKSNKYDVIISDLFIPWHSYTGYLYTKEHYQVAIASLEPNGLFCQWLPLYQLGQSEFEIIANTFSSVFKNVLLWRGEDDNKYPLLALIGSKHQNDFDMQNIKSRLDKLSIPRPIKVNLQQGSIRILMPEDKLLKFESFFSLYIGKWQLQQGSILNTDAFPYIEFLAPITENQKACLRNMRLLQYYKDVFEKLPDK